MPLLDSKPGTVSETDTGLLTASAAEPISESYTPPYDDSNSNRKLILDALDLTFEEHFVHAPQSLKDRFYNATTPTIAGEALVHLARVDFGSHRFEFSETGTWAIIAPIHSETELYPVDLAAFDLRERDLKRVYRGLGYAVGIEEALFDARFHPERRTQIHCDVWSWLCNECVGILPVDWHATTLLLKQRRIAGLVTTDDVQAREVSRLMQAALAPLPIFVKRYRDAS